MFQEKHEILGNNRQVEKARIPGPEEQKERNEGDVRRDAGGQEAVQQNKKIILTEEQDMEEEEEETLNLARSVEGKKYNKYVLTIRNKYLVLEVALTLHKVLIPERKDLIRLTCPSRTILPLKAL